MKEIRIENKKELERYINGEYVIQDKILSNDDVKFVVGDNNFNTKLEVYNFDPKICANMHYSEKEIKDILDFVRYLHHEEAPDFWGNRYLKIKFKNDWNKPDSIVIDASTVWNEKKFIKAMKKVYRKDAQISLNYSNMYMSTKKRNLVSINAFSIPLHRVYKEYKNLFFSNFQLLIIKTNILKMRELITP